MIRHVTLALLAILLGAPLALAQGVPAGRGAAATMETIALGKLPNGAAVEFNRDSTGDWRINVTGGGAPAMG